jgi:hypothetical protein
MPISEFRPRKYYCTDAKVAACRDGFKTLGGYRQHRNAVHSIGPSRPVSPRQHTFSGCGSDEAGMETGHDGGEKGPYYIRHPVLDGSPCDAMGNYLSEGHPPPDPDLPAKDDAWFPFASRGHFALADFIFKRSQMPAKQIDDLMQVLASFDEFRGKPPFNSDADVHDSIDAIPLGDVPWQSLSLKHPNFDNPSPDDAPWKHTEYEVWFRDPRELIRHQLANPDFANDIDYSARQVFGEQGQRVWTDLMTGNWAWDQSVSTMMVFNDELKY